MRKWSRPLWTIFIAIICIVLGFFGYNIYQWYSVDRLWLLFTFLGAELILFIGVTCFLKRSHYLHLHHYTFAMILIPLNSI